MHRRRGHGGWPIAYAAVALLMLVGIAASAFLRRLPAESSDLKHGLVHLAGLRWRDFAKLVLQALHARGYRPAADEGLPADGIPTDGSDIVLERDGVRTLLSCKYGSAAVVGAQALLGLAKSATLRGTGEVIVVTPGRFDEEAARIARARADLAASSDPEADVIAARAAAEDAASEVARMRAKLTDNQARKADLQTARDEAKLPGLRLHDLRHAADPVIAFYTHGRTPLT